MTAYYNENDPKAAAWLRELIKQGHIAPGVVDERSIIDVRPYELRNFAQCHFFAGIGTWSFALRNAGWDDDRPVWTGSCPCQPFSAAGKGNGFADERHVWPSWFHLISQCKPAVIFGEQVASKDGLAWLDLVQSDLEASDYAVGAADLCAAGFGAPHIRQRLFFMAYTESRGSWAGLRNSGSTEFRRFEDSNRLRPSRMADADGGDTGAERQQRSGEYGQRPQDGGAVVVEHAKSDGRDQGDGEFGECSKAGRPSPTNGHWRDADWLLCRDGKWRPVEPGTFPLVNGASARVGRLRGYGNGIVESVARGFIEAAQEAIE